MNRGHYNRYFRCPWVGDAFIEQDGVTKGRWLFDGSYHWLGIEVWIGSWHLSVDLDHRIIRTLTALLFAAMTAVGASALRASSASNFVDPVQPSSVEDVSGTIYT